MRSIKEDMVLICYNCLCRSKRHFRCQRKGTDGLEAQIRFRQPIQSWHEIDTELTGGHDPSVKLCQEFEHKETPGVIENMVVYFQASSFEFVPLCLCTKMMLTCTVPDFAGLPMHAYSIVLGARTRVSLVLPYAFHPRIQSPPIQTSFINSSNSSSSSHPPPPRLFTTILLSSFSFCSATAPRISLSCSSLTFCRICPVRASIIRRFSMSVARDSFTRRIRPRRSAASGVRIWERMEERWSAGVVLDEVELGGLELWWWEEGEV
jgi:hypothetical protein